LVVVVPSDYEASGPVQLLDGVAFWAESELITRLGQGTWKTG